MNFRTAQLSMLMLLVGCGTVSESHPRPAATGAPDRISGIVYTQEVSAVGPSIHAVRASDGFDLGNVPRGLTSPDGRRSYQLQAGISTATLVVTDNRIGKVNLILPVAAGFNLAEQYLGGGGPGPLSPNGRWLVLFQDRAPAGVRDAVGFEVVDTTGITPPRIARLNGHFEFDAVDNAGSTLYLVERPGDSAAYRVRAFDLGAGMLKPGVIAEKGPIQEPMSGYRAASVSPGDGSWLFSLYQKPAGSTFIHALSLKDQFAVCIDLPVANEHGVGNRYWSLASDGRTVYAVNTARGEAISIDINGLNVTRHSTFTVAAPVATQGLARRLSGNAQMAADRASFLAAGPDGVVQISTTNLGLNRVMLRGDVVSDVRLIGKTTLLALVPGRKSIEVIELLTGKVARSLALTDSPTGIAAVAP